MCIRLRTQAKRVTANDAFSNLKGKLIFNFYSMKGLIDAFAESFSHSEGNVQLYNSVLEKSEQFFHYSESLASPDPLLGKGITLLFSEKYHFILSLKEKLQHLAAQYKDSQCKLRNLNVELNFMKKIRENRCSGFFSEFIAQLEQIYSGNVSPIDEDSFETGIECLKQEYIRLKEGAVSLDGSSRDFESFQKLSVDFVQFYFLICYLIYQSNTALLHDISSLTGKLRYIFLNGQEINKQVGKCTMPYAIVDYFVESQN